jgi:hypothetical protein
MKPIAVPFQPGHRYLVQLSPRADGHQPTEVICLEISPRGWVKFRIPGRGDVWYSPDDLDYIQVLDRLGPARRRWTLFRNRIVTE